MATGEQSDNPRAGDASDSGFTLESLVAPRSRFSRFAALAGTLLLIMSALVGLFFSATHDPAGAIDTLLQVSTPTPAATPMPGDNDINFVDAVPWGALRIDGKRIDLTALARRAFSGIAVSRGSHQLIYQANDFPTLRCDFTVPLATSDTCPLDSSIGGVERISMGEGRTIDLGATADRLPSSQRDALLAAIETQLQTDHLSAAIAPGDRYLHSYNTVVSATEPLRLSFGLSFATESGSGPRADCLELCDDTSALIPGIAASDSLWHLQLTLDTTWTLTNSAGQLVETLPYQGGTAFSNTNVALIGVQRTASGWRISGADTLTAQAAVVAQQRAIDHALKELGVRSPTASFNVGANPLLGSFVSLTLVDTNDGSAHDVSLLWRFGVVFTIGDIGQQALPFLPRANATEAATLPALQRQGVSTTPLG